MSHVARRGLRAGGGHRRGGSLDWRPRPRGRRLVDVRADTRGVERGDDLLSQQREPSRSRQGGHEGGARRRSDRGRAHAGPLLADRRRPHGRARQARIGVKPENIVLGAGSTQILRTATHLFTAKDKPLVGTIPTYEECAGYAEMMGHPVRPVRARRRLPHRSRQVRRRPRKRRRAGLLLQPEQPDRHLRRRDGDARLPRPGAKDSPETTVLVDEAYFDYVTDPDHATTIPLALDNPRVVVARTFSKAYGMAGLRVGFAVGHADTIKKMRDWDGGPARARSTCSALHAGARRRRTGRVVHRQPSAPATPRRATSR